MGTVASVEHYSTTIGHYCTTRFYHKDYIIVSFGHLWGFRNGRMSHGCLLTPKLRILDLGIANFPSYLPPSPKGGLRHKSQ